eukprot:TRINITY_DN29525_c0_g1_i1.p1 TRINITY_DN29525_c0_g1~~TRINITY_DN29525_c0_g1_i1.p1  ORF type:complete len:590 (-),score=42.76 TRINITY_DN29525_c0_g1_i1:152-1921(-)
MSSLSSFNHVLHQQVVAHQKMLREQASAAELLAEGLKSLCASSALWLSEGADAVVLDSPQLDSIVPVVQPPENLFSGEMQRVRPRGTVNSLFVGYSGNKVVEHKKNEKNSSALSSARSSFVKVNSLLAPAVPECEQMKHHPSDLSIYSGRSDLPPPQPTRSMRQSRQSVVGTRLTRTSRLFADAEQLTQNMEDQVVEEILIERVYAETGVSQKFVTHPAFERVSFRIVMLSCIWMAVEIDLNTSDSLYSSNPVFPIVANVFCLFFLFEVCLRVAALRTTKIIFSQYSLFFDAALVILIMIETWIMPAILTITRARATTNKMNSVVVILKTLQLLRVLRVGRVLRELPEVLHILQGIRAASQGILIIIMLLVVAIHLAAIVFRIILEGTDLGHSQFASVPSAMGTLLIEGALSGSKGAALLRACYVENMFYSALMMAFVLFTNILMMGMLAGLLVQTVRATAESEKDERSLKSAQALLSQIWEMALEHDNNGDGLIDKDELISTIADADTQVLLQQMGVDIEGLNNVSDFIFSQHDGRLSKAQFKRMILDLRGGKFAKVKDHVETRKFIRSQRQQIHGVGTYSLRPSCIE